jgi:hypothetical protein
MSSGDVGSGERGLLVEGAMVPVTDERGNTPSRWERCDVLVVGERIASVAPSMPDEPGAEVLRADGAFVVPLQVESALRQGGAGRAAGARVAAGNPATFAVVRRSVTAHEIRHMLVVSPRDLGAVLVDGHLEAREGSPTRAAGADIEDVAVAALWVGTWSDPVRALDQHLLPSGRYTETRSGRADAYTGRYWVRGDRITYLDDSGFWAFGELLDGVLHHAGFVMTRRTGNENGLTPTVE